MDVRIGLSAANKHWSKTAAFTASQFRLCTDAFEWAGNVPLVWRTRPCPWLWPTGLFKRLQSSQGLSVWSAICNRSLHLNAHARASFRARHLHREIHFGRWCPASPIAALQIDL